MNELVCIACPTGCRLTVVEADDGPRVRGAVCERGREYALAELVTPVRMFTGTVRVRGGVSRVAPVRSDTPVPRDELMEVARRTARIVVDAPVAAGDVVAGDLPGGCCLISTAGVACR